ncbi:hypothetical protein HAL07_02850 [Helicobacter ailurogastricus]|uniref:Uncharacterized protein n=1 Tax=Helicobacter ailurogastricus TaxID=1578720 RepID=A0A0K2Y2U3_9HELI|nr:hypothetical protein HAL07_02850 [Helicobacter ailurogastricus]
MLLKVVSKSCPFENHLHKILRLPMLECRRFLILPQGVFMGRLSR